MDLQEKLYLRMKSNELDTLLSSISGLTIIEKADTMIHEEMLHCWEYSITLTNQPDIKLKSGHLDFLYSWIYNVSKSQGSKTDECGQSILYVFVSGFSQPPRKVIVDKDIDWISELWHMGHKNIMFRYVDHGTTFVICNEEYYTAASVFNGIEKLNISPVLKCCFDLSDNLL